MAPSAQRVNPLARTYSRSFGTQHVCRLPSRFDTIQSHFLRPGLTAAHKVRMVVDEARNNSPAHEIDALGCRARELRNFSSSSHGENALALDCNSLGNGKPVVDGNDFSVGENNV